MEKYNEWLDAIISGEKAPLFDCEVKDEGVGTTEFWGSVSRDVRKYEDCCCYVETHIDESFDVDKFSKLFEEKREDLQISLRESIPDYLQGENVKWSTWGFTVKVYIQYVSTKGL